MSAAETIVRVVDVETTGIDDDAQVVELGWIDVVARKIVGSPQSTLVRATIPIPPEASSVHHIVDADLDGAPTLSEAVDLIAGADVYVAHNIAFDGRFLGDALGAVPWVCTYKAALRGWPDAPGHSNQTLRYWRGHCLSGEERGQAAHRAAADVYVTAHVLIDLLNSFGSQDLFRWTAEPTILPRITFGKHKGGKWEDVPTDYLEWIVTKATDMTPERIETARYHLTQRGAGR